MSKNKHLNCLRDEKAALAKENSGLLKENDELRRDVPSTGSGSKRDQDDFRARSNSRGRSERSVVTLSGRRSALSRKRSTTILIVNFDRVGGSDSKFRAGQTTADQGQDLDL